MKTIYILIIKSKLLEREKIKKTRMKETKI